MIPIQTIGLTKRYGAFTALAGLDLEVQRGEVFGFLGPNGAGKSTTIRLLLGELLPSSGSAQILGSDPRGVAHRARLGYLPADVGLWPNLTGRQTLQFFEKLRGGLDRGWVDSLAERLDANLDKRVGELSTGNRQKIGLIAAFMHKPELLILDEPNAGLDPLIQHEFVTMLREVADEGRTVFLSSHTLSEVERAADRVGIIRSGELVAVESVAQLRAKSLRRIQVTCSPESELSGVASLPGVRNLEVTHNRASFDFDGEIAQLLARLPSGIQDLRIEEADLEDIFLTYYQGQ